MKIVLIQPEIPGGQSWCPPLGLAYVAAAVENDEHEVQIIDLNATRLSDAQLLKTAYYADIIGITSMMNNYKDALRLAKLFDGGEIVFGGPQPSVRPEMFIEDSNAIVIKGEAEKSFPLYLRERERGNSGLNTPGLIFQANTGKVIYNPQPALMSNLDNCPMPARHLLDMEAYHTTFHGRRTTSVISSRGCPFDCIFCYHDFLGKIYRARTPESIVSEIETLQQQYDIGGIIFYDDNFTFNHQRVYAFCDLLIKRKLDIAWWCLSRVDGVNAELLSKMKEAGCCKISFGVESGTQQTLDRTHKKTKVEDAINAIQLCHDVGITTKSLLMIGFPWETKTDIEKTVEFIEQLLPGEIHLSIAVPYPGTCLEQMLMEQGIEIDKDIDITDYANPSFETNNFTKSDLIHYRKLGYDKIEMEIKDQ